MSDTIRTKIVNVDLFEENPALLMLGMVCAVTASSIYLTIATKLGMPVSTTHSIMGGVIGMGIAAVGADGIHWWGGNINSGVVQVFIAWILAPVLSSAFGSIVFLITEYCVMLRSNPVMKAFITVPIYFGITSALLTMLIVWKGGSSRITLTEGETAGVIVGVGAAVALVVTIFFLPWLYRRLIKEDWQLKWWHLIQGPLHLRRGEVSPPPEGNSTTVVQDYYRGHMTMVELEAHRATFHHQNKPGDVENNGGLPTKEGSANISETDNSNTASSEPERDHISIVGPRPSGGQFSPAVLFWQFKRFFFRGIEKDVVGLQNKRNLLTGDLEEIHAHSQHYDNKAEYCTLSCKF